MKLDTNGSFPGRLKQLAESGLLDSVAMDIKHAPGKYALATGISGDVLPAVQENVSYLLSAPMDCEFRTTVVHGMHTAEDIAAIGRWIQGAQRYFLQNFADSGDVLTPGLAGVAPDTLQAMLAAAQEYVPGAQIRGT